MEDVTELESRAGDVGVVPGGHDAWVVDVVVERLRRSRGFGFVEFSSDVLGRANAMSATAATPPPRSAGR